jgi:hypothetical protein
MQADTIEALRILKLRDDIQLVFSDVNILGTHRWADTAGTC